MLNRPYLGVIILLSAILASACLRILKHDQGMAATAALEFAELALVRGETEAAYVQLHPEGQKNMTPIQLKAMLAQVQLDRRPLTVHATDYEPLAGQAGMYIYLLGENGSRRFFYRFYMIGSASEGYHVAGLYASDGPLPGSARRPL
jgi:hypothetical protein